MVCLFNFFLIQIVSTRSSILTQTKQEFKYLHVVYVTLGP